jgi:hypothetical protein
MALCAEFSLAVLHAIKSEALKTCIIDLVFVIKVPRWSGSVGNSVRFPTRNRFACLCFPECTSALTYHSESMVASGSSIHCVTFVAIEAHRLVKGCGGLRSFAMLHLGQAATLDRLACLYFCEILRGLTLNLEMVIACG